MMAALSKQHSPLALGERRCYFYLCLFDGAVPPFLGGYQGLCGRGTKVTYKPASLSCWWASTFHPLGCFQRNSGHWLPHFNPIPTSACCQFSFKAPQLSRSATAFMPTGSLWTHWMSIFCLKQLKADTGQYHWGSVSFFIEKMSSMHWAGHSEVGP